MFNFFSQKIIVANDVYLPSLYITASLIFSNNRTDYVMNEPSGTTLDYAE